MAWWWIKRARPTHNLGPPPLHTCPYARRSVAPLTESRTYTVRVRVDVSFLCVQLTPELCTNHNHAEPTLALTTSRIAYCYLCVTRCSPVSWMPIMTMRATQKNRMSWPVSSSEVG